MPAVERRTGGIAVDRIDAVVIRVLVRDEQEVGMDVVDRRIVEAQPALRQAGDAGAERIDEDALRAVERERRLAVPADAHQLPPGGVEGVPPPRRPARCARSAWTAAWSCSSESGGTACGVAASAAQSVEQPVQMPAPGGRLDRGRRVDQRGERPEQQGEIGEREIGAQAPLLARALEDLLEQLRDLLPRALDPAGARRRAQEDVLEQAVAGLDLERLLEVAHESLPAVGLGGGGLGDRDELADAPLEDGLDECVARREVPVERAGADARAPRDLLERGLDAPLGEHLAGRGDEQLVIAPRVAPLPRLLARDACHAAIIPIPEGSLRYLLWSDAWPPNVTKTQTEPDESTRP